MARVLRLSDGSQMIQVATIWQLTLSFHRLSAAAPFLYDGDEEPGVRCGIRHCIIAVQRAEMVSVTWQVVKNKVVSGEESELRRRSEI